MDARRGPSGLPMLQKGILLLQRFESLTFKGRGLRVSDRMLDRAFAVRIAYPGRVGHDTVMTSHHGVPGCELGLGQVGRKHPFPQLIHTALLLRAPVLTPALRTHSLPHSSLVLPVPP